MSISQTSVTNSKQPDEDMLLECLERIVADIYGRRSKIVRVQRRRSDYSSWYASDILTVQLAAGNKINFLLKDYGTYRAIKEGLNRRRERELRVYRDLLAQADLGTARYYGSVSDESEGRFWLFLEFVNGTPVRYCDFEYWVTAAGWLGRMQGYFAQHANLLKSCDFLLRHNADFFRSKADLALYAVSHLCPAFVERLAKLVRGYDRLVDVMASQQPTFVHGAYRPEEILVGVDSEPLRVCPVDWELASLGSNLFDLAFLADGFEPPRLHQIFNAYRQNAMEHYVTVPDHTEMTYIVNCFRLYRVINWLSQSLDKNYPESKVVGLIELGERHRTLVF